MSDDEDFLSRWSRRKTEARRVREPRPEEAAGLAEPEPMPETPALPVPELPDPATLDAGSDFKAFLAPNVPGDLRRAALRRLWRLNPIINSLDGLDDHYVTQDFTDAATVLPGLRTIYRVGKGMVDAVARLDDAAGPAPAELEVQAEPDLAAAQEGVGSEAVTAKPQTSPDETEHLRLPPVRSGSNLPK
jgi:hypothetical protein